MATPFDFDAPQTPGAAAAGAAAPASARRKQRQPLSLPAGSVRALLALSILGLLAAIVLQHKQAEVPLLYVYLWYLLFLALASFFAGHGSTIGGASHGSPLGLPGGTVRFLLLAGITGLAVYLYLNWDETALPAQASATLPIMLLTGYLAGLLLSFLVHRPLGGAPWWFQDIQAWLAILAVCGMGIELVLQLVINPSLAEQNRLDLGHWEGVLAAVIGFYFGARS